MLEKRKSVGGLREVTRLFAVQVMYAADILNKSVSDVLKGEYSGYPVVLDENISLNDIDLAFFEELVNAYSSHASAVNQIISTHISKTWTVERLNKVLIAILKLGITELLYLPSIPSNVTFNEYIEISKSYFNKHDVSFVNGLLNMVHENNKSIPNP